MRAMTIVLISAAATLGIAACTPEAETVPEPVAQAASEPLEHSGPAVGETIPADFRTRDASGAERRFEDLSGENGLVLVFNRSADWCSYCQGQMVELRDIQDDLEQRGYVLATLSYDAPEILADFAAREEIEYPMLSDEGSVTIDAFDLRDPQYGEESFANGVPRPAILVIGNDGTVRAKMVETDYRTRPEPADIVAAVDAL
ncbi:peroxiredoxin family protein [Parasphingopyxis algicola]|uniref:peroxiredoxin family protein n=1 Tax=Parasphingopyxis algicola TaxID=2026624 RepID=UPI0015A135FC|nr:peroxiredoxin family protein [Parasphingopyxis algicola]QLC25155.1 peroxiredoxin family protein [Parasphingopyxis algicola]